MKIIRVNFKKENGLVSAIIQEEKTGKVLMLGYMNRKALEKTRETGLAYFWSRSKSRLWKKGETSGNTLSVKRITTDCDNDALLITVVLNGKSVCHTGAKSCFY